MQPLGLMDYHKNQGISAYWRKNTSSAEATELANVLRALRKVAGHLGENVGRIEYVGMSHGDPGGIVLEPTPIMGEYPVPSTKIDFLVGLVTHESLHRIQWSDHVWKLLEPVFVQTDPLPLIFFQKIVFFGEDNFVDFIADRTIFGLYTRKVRQNDFAEIQRKLPVGVISVDALMFAWWVSTWEEPPEGLDPVYEAPLKRLRTLNEELEALGQSSLGVVRRCEERARLYEETWRDLKDQVADWKILDKRLYWYPAGQVRKASPAAAERPKRPTGPLAQGLIDEIETKLAANSVDITPIIRSVVGYDNESVAPMSRWDYNFTAHPLIDRRLVSRLRAIFQLYAARNRVRSRGLTFGKVDRRRLYRAPVTGRCFESIDFIPDLDWNVTLLMDASGSMRGSKWRMVENTVANLHKALIGYRNRLQAYAYFESDGICMFSSLIKGRHLLSIPPSGQTASGQALIAAAWFMPKGRKQNVLIHVTDGETNFGVDVQAGIDYCQKQNIHLVTLGCGYKDRAAMEQQYGRTIQFLNHFGQLPQAIERLLRWTFLYGSKPHLKDDAFFRLNGDNSPDQAGS